MMTGTPTCVCERALAKVNLPSQDSTTFVKRTCRHCGARWQVRIEAHRIRAGAWVHELTLTGLDAARKAGATDNDDDNSGAKL